MTPTTAGVRAKKGRRGRNTKAEAVRKNLTIAKVVDALKPKAGEYRVYDERLPGFGIRVAPTGAKSFFAQYRSSEGIKRRMYLGDSRKLTPKEAQALAQSVLSKATLGTDPLKQRQEDAARNLATARGKREAKQAQRDAPTVADVAKAYLESCDLSSSPKWAAEARRLYNLHLDRKLGSVKIADVDVIEVRKLHEKMRDTPVLANRVRSLLSAIITRAIKDEQRAKDNPVSKVNPYDEQPRDRYLSADEWQRFAKAITAERKALANVPKWDTRPRQLDAIMLLALTGGRKEAVTRRRWDELDVEARVLRIVPAHKGARRLYLGETALSVLQGWHAQRGADSPYIFAGQTRKGKAPSPIATIDLVWDSLRDRAKLENFHVHDIRRSFATAGADIGISEYLMGGLLSHKAAGVTGDVYAHRTDPALADAANRVSAEVAKRLELRAKDKKIIPIRASA